MSTGMSRLLLGSGLLVTLVAAWFAPPAKDDNVVLSERAQNARPANVGAPTMATPVAPHATSVSTFEVLSIRPRTLGAEEDAVGESLFSSSQWMTNKQVAASVVADVPAPAPQAPPLPFRFLGRYTDAGQSVIFLQYNDQNLVVRLGDTLGEQYKVEKIDETTLSLRYLPLNQLQSLDAGANR